MGFITARIRSLQRLCFYTWAGTPPWAGTPLAGTPPGQVHPPGQVPPCEVHTLGRYTPWQVHPSPGRYTPQAGTPPGRYPWAGTPPPWQVHPLGGTPPRAVHAGSYGQQVGGTYPTGMRSCSRGNYSCALDLINACIISLKWHPHYEPKLILFDTKTMG